MRSRNSGHLWTSQRERIASLRRGTLRKEQSTNSADHTPRLRNVDLQDYIASLSRTSQSLAELQRTNMRANQQAVAEMSALLKRGMNELEDAFRDILRESCRQTIVPLEYVIKSSVASFSCISSLTHAQTIRFPRYHRTSFRHYDSSILTYRIHMHKYRNQTCAKRRHRGYTARSEGNT